MTPPAPPPSPAPLPLRGRVWKLGDDVNTDVIYSGRWLNVFDPAEAAKHALETLDPEFPKKLRPGDILVAGKFFGCGSSREMAVVCLKAAGVQAIVAKSFARIYFRNAVNQGLWVVPCPGTDRIQEGDTIAVDPLAGTVLIERTGERLSTGPIPPFLAAIVQEGGLIPHLRRKVASRSAATSAADPTAGSEVG